MSLEEIRRSAENGRLVVVLGAGASMALTPKSKKAMSWTDLVRSGLSFGQERGLINDVQLSRNLEALTSDDIDDLLGVAEFVGRKLEAPNGDIYARWMRTAFDGWKPEPGGMQNALRAIEEQKIPIATLNYDTLVETCTGLVQIDFADIEALMAWLRRERQGILHLHGVWTSPNKCVFGIRDYQVTLSDEVRQMVQRSLSSLNRLLFIGCGDTLSDPNFSGLVSWLRKNVGANAPQHYALVRSSEVRSKLSDPNWRGFVEPVSYGDDYSDLPGFLLNCFPTRSSPRAHASKKKLAAGHNTRVLGAYRDFLLRDCGEMTIEGMRADMDTAQRKFELEKLFVPLDVLPLPPDIPQSDPDRETKIQKWHREHALPIPFSSAFETTKKMALLALPGGGKTLLLKRLAVAYAHPSRRESSLDNLPALDLLPIMIRCREWKDHIRNPIASLLSSVATITGERDLEGLADALQKPLKSGAVLLLVDGLDEIHDDGDRSTFVENLEKFLASYPKIRLLVTSREAGFDLVAPCLVRFCTKLKIAPLNEEAIAALCNHWQRLMIGSTPEALAEGASVAEALLATDSLRRLAENPLLLTMLLVVKHGAGRLPPDRVSLYERAVEILLDTWNIKGHEALNTKEAVPQLACLAFELLHQGKQTATEKEILGILEEARNKLPMVGRYAKDSPYGFLKRVELRSSLVLEGGHKNEDGKVVPFYQFRHLTFQEYLAAVAAVESYTLTKENVGPLAVLRDNLISDEWKEVIPMAAVLARSQAGPLIEALVEAAELEAVEFSQDRKSRTQLLGGAPRLLRATGRLVQAMVEEAIFPPEALQKTVRLVALLANACRTATENWQALSRGPYGPDLRSAAVELYVFDPYDQRMLTRNTVALFEAHSEPPGFWLGDDCEPTMLKRLKERDTKNLARHILSIAGGFWLNQEKSSLVRSREIYSVLEVLMFDERPAIKIAAGWAWGFWRHLRSSRDRVKPRPSPSNDTLALLVNSFFDENDKDGAFWFLLEELSHVKRGQCKMNLTSNQENILRTAINSNAGSVGYVRNPAAALIRMAFIIEGVFTDSEIVAFIQRNDLSRGPKDSCRDILEVFGLSTSTKSGRAKAMPSPVLPASS